MARNSVWIDAPPAKVFEVLLDPYAYASWVVGSKATRGADESWPSPGAAFYHTSGAGPADVKDQTKIVEIDAPRRLVLHAYFRPLGVMRVDLRVTPSDGGTLFTIDENPAPGTRTSRIRALVSPVTHVRNRESVRRLKHLAEQRARDR